MNLHHSWNSAQYEKTSELQSAVAVDLIEDLQIKPYENVLDVGCGIGNITMKIASLAFNGQVLGIDASPPMIEKARENLRPSNAGTIRFQVMGAEELQFDKEFDVVFSNSVLHWIKKQDKALQSMRRCLKPGGRIGLQFPILNTSHPMVRLANKAIHALRLEHNYSDWVFPWYVPVSAAAYRDLLERIHFQNVTVREVETFYTFERAPTAIGFFNSVGLDLFLQPISSQDRISLKNEMIRLIEHSAAGTKIRLDFHRLFAQASL